MRTNARINILIIHVVSVISPSNALPNAVRCARLNKKSCSRLLSWNASYLAGDENAFPHTEVTDDEDTGQAGHKFPAEFSQVHESAAVV